MTLDELNNTATDYPRDRCLHELFEAQASASPDSIAVVCGNESLTYRELNERAALLADQLVTVGIGPDVLTAICLDRSVEMVVAVIGVLKSGGAYVPIDPAYPADRIAFMLEDAAVKAIVSRHSLAEAMSSPKTPIILIDELAPMVDPPPLYRSPTPENLAYVRYTSGSTGKPKGVQIEHRSIVNFITSMRKTPGLSDSDVLFSVTTLSFDISELEIHLPLTTGARVVIGTWETATSGSALIASITSHSVTVMQATPATWRLMLEAGWTGTPGLKVLCGGEALRPDLVRQLIPRCAELWNMYGPTETTVWSTCCRITDPDDISIGRPIANTQVHIVDANQQPLTVGEEGELLIGGDSVARGYLNRPELTADKFISYPLKPGQRLYRTGDLARIRHDGMIDCLGRLDFQIKVQGFRIEPGEIETVLATHPEVRQAVVVAQEDTTGDKRLVAYFTTSEGKTPSVSELRALVQDRLPSHMVPAAFVALAKIPLTPNGKIDSKALPKPTNQRPALSRDFIAPNSQLERQMAALWSEVLNIEPVGIDDSFFELGGTSLQAVRLVAAWQNRHGHDLPLVKLFQYPTVAGIVAWLENRNDTSGFLAEQERRALRSRSAAGGGGKQSHIAIIGMAGRFPGANNLETLWQNLCAGVESISVFSREELGIGIDEAMRYDPDYVPARGIIEDAEMFDAAFFGIGTLEASVMDPQQRVFLELAYAALESAGYDPDRCPGMVGVYAGAGDNHYYAVNLLGHPQLLARAGRLAVETGNEKDYLALRVAYLLNLTGPAVSSNTACSTTLLTLDQAVRGLASFECDMALAGGIDITIPQKSGFFYEEGGAFSRDGHCRPFDADATGTMFCDGAGIVVLKRLDDAMADGDTIYAVIRGTAKNNNGGRTASFLAPSVEGQAEVIAMAQANADVPVETIGYIEAHGTGTPVGDPIEIEALNKVFNAKTVKREFCYLGSIKGNIGHPTNAAGVAGVIKAALVLHREEIPPTLHFRKANPKIDFENSCFKVSDRLISFPRNTTPRRAAVSCFGFGGTNVHAILEEAPPPKPSGSSRPVHLVAVSARTGTSLEAYSGALAEYFKNSKASDFADAAATLLRGRKQWPHRRFVVTSTADEAVALLRKPNPLRSAARHCTRRDPPVVFLFGGQGTQYVNMGQNLYQTEPLFRATIDECCEALRPHLGCDLRTILYPAKADEETASTSLRNTFYTQPAIFTIEYALAVWWRSLGVEPATMVGHSIGEFVAATIAGVFSLSDVLRIVATRGRLMQSMPGGAMLSVRASADEVQPLLPAEVELAAINSPTLCVVSGPTELIPSVLPIFEARGWVYNQLFTSHAFHSHMMEPMLEPLRRELAGITLRAPIHPLMSTVTGEPMTPEQACDPDYWARQARMTVRFSATATWLLDHGYDLFLECGPRATMSTLTRQHAFGRPITTIPSMGDSNEANTESAALLFGLGSLWLQGITIDWEAFYAHEERHRIPLPTYPFERQRHWVEPIAATAGKIEPSDQSVAATATAPGERPQYQTDTLPIKPVENRLDKIHSRLSEIVGQIIGQNPVAIDINITFFELGLDSLALVQVSAALRNELKVKVGFRQLMNEFPSIAMLTEHLDTMLPPGSFGAEPAASPVPSTDTLSGEPGPAAADLRQMIEEQGRMISLLAKQMENLMTQSQYATTVTRAISTPQSTGSVSAIPPEIELPTTVPQRGIFLSSRLSDNLSASYNESVTIHITGHIDLDRLTSAIRSLVKRHDALRARFDESGWSMSLPPVRNVSIDVVDLSGLNANAQEHQLESLTAGETARAFPLPAGPLFRARVIKLDAARADVVLTGHHAICDGWSLDVLVHDLCAYYSSELEDQPDDLQPVMSYGEYVRKCATRAGSSEFLSAQQYYEARFAEMFPALVLPTVGERSGMRRFACQQKEVVVPPSVMQSLRAFCAHHKCGLFALVLTAYSISLARISGQYRFVIALPFAEQLVLDQPHLVGHCVNMLPFDVSIQPDEKVADFLAGVQHQLSHVYDHSAYTVTHLIQRLRPATPHVGIRPVSVGLTSLKKWQLSDLPQKGFTIDFDVTPRQFESFEFYLMAIERQDELVLRCNFDCDLFDQTTVAGWMQELALLLSAFPEKSAVMLESLIKPTIAPLTPSPSVHYILTTDSSDQEVCASTEPESPTIQGNRTALTLDALIRVWQDVLDTKSIEPDDNFFDLGGQSLLALSLSLKVQKTFGVRYPLAGLLKAPTPRQSLVFLQDSNLLKNSDHVVPIATGGNLTPLFLFHSHGGNVLEYYRLATLLRNDRSVYAIQCHGVDGEELSQLSVEQLAEAYLQEIRVVQPNGPYILAGYCFGGLLALEAAQQLQAAGQEIALVVMINATTADYLQRRVHGVSWLRRMTWRMGDRLAIEHFIIAGKPLPEKLSKLRGRMGRMIDLLQVRAERIATRGLALVGLNLMKHSFVFHLEKLGLNNDLAYFQYVPLPYDGKALLFVAERQPREVVPDPMLGWKRLLTGNVSHHMVPGSRQHLLDEPAVFQLADTIKRTLADADL